MPFLKQHSSAIALGILTAFTLLLVFLAQADSLTYDERAHIPAAYSYVRYGDIRLNPEHPPLLKDLAGFPLLFLPVTFPIQATEWISGTNEQWAMGDKFLNCTSPSEACNNTALITFWARLPLILVAVSLGAFLFWWTRKAAGPLAGLLALTLFAADPNIIAHGHYVTTDVGIAAFLFFAFYFFLEFLKRPTWKNTLLAALFFTIVQMIKFSAVLLIPIFGLFIIVYALARTTTLTGATTTRIRSLFFYLGRSIVVFLVFIVGVYIVYTLHTRITPPEHLVAIAHMMFPEKQLGPLARTIVETTSQQTWSMPFSAYLLGVLMVFGRVAGGNTHYFLDTVQSAAQKSYFPIIFLAKETLPFLALTALTLFYTLRRFFHKTVTQRTPLSTLITDHIDSALMLFFIVFYSFLSIIGNLNIGFRHLFPILPFLYFLVAKNALQMTRDPLFSKNTQRAFGYTIGVLAFLQLLTPLSAHPYYLSYYNLLAGGTPNGYKVATDSNYDWGQDLHRLKTFITEHNSCLASNGQSTSECPKNLQKLPPIEKIHVDYFGGASAQHELGTFFDGWWSERDPEPGWYAISINTLQENWTTNNNPATKQNDKNYLWLKDIPLAGRAGTSIFIYYLPEQQ